MMRVMITGATSGIGRELTLAYDKNGHEVIACGRNQQKLLTLQSEGDNIEILCFDLMHFERYPEVEGKVDLLILNAGQCEYIDSPLAFDGKCFERIINANLISVGYCLDAWLNNIQRGGRLVLIGSSAGLLPLPRAEAYGSSKAAVRYLAQTLSLSLKKHDISVTLVQPGFVDTPLTRKNTFPMPMLMNSALAADKIVLGISRGKSEINVPILFVFIMRVFRFLPAWVWQRFATRMI